MPSNTDGVITAIKKKPGIILEKMARLATSTTTWVLIQRVDLMPYFQRLDRIENSLRNISLVCDEINCTHVQIIKEVNIHTIEAKNNVERVIDLLKSHGEGGLIADNIMQFELDTTVLTDSVLFASQGALHPRFVSPNQIEQSAELVEKRLPDAVFPTLVTGGNIATW